MHRVELKAWVICCAAFCWAVPNAPCGVERSSPMSFNSPEGVKEFLMHRVELKVSGSITLSASLLLTWFLMHRVELKAAKGVVSFLC